MAAIPGFPDESEYSPRVRGYVAGITDGDIVKTLITQRDDLRSLLSHLEGAYAYEPGKWTVSEVLGHITDCERVFAYRTLCVARGDQTPLPPFEQDDYMANANFASRTLEDIFTEFEEVRDSSILLLQHLPAEAWMRRGTVSGFSVTTRGLAFLLAGHEKHHTSILRQKYLKH
jgi:uncharacterized damage-inducible protein DinB